MRVPRVGPPQQNKISVFHLGVRGGSAADSKHCRQTDDARRVSSSVTGINVVRTHSGAHEFLCGVVHFVRALRTTEETECLMAALVDGLGNPLAARVSASSQVASRSSPFSRTSGLVMRARGLGRSVFEFIKAPGSRLPWRDEPLSVYGASKGWLSTAGIFRYGIIQCRGTDGTMDIAGDGVSPRQ